MYGSNSALPSSGWDTPATVVTSRSWRMLASKPWYNLRPKSRPSIYCVTCSFFAFLSLMVPAITPSGCASRSKSLPTCSKSVFPLSSVAAPAPAGLPQSRPCALAISEGRQPNECLRLVQSLRNTDVTPGLWHDLLTLYQ